MFRCQTCYMPQKFKFCGLNHFESAVFDSYSRQPSSTCSKTDTTHFELNSSSNLERVGKRAALLPHLFWLWRLLKTLYWVKENERIIYWRRVFHNPSVGLGQKGVKHQDQDWPRISFLLFFCFVFTWCCVLISNYAQFSFLTSGWVCLCGSFCNHTGWCTWR